MRRNKKLMEKHKKTPIFTALKKHIHKQVIPFHVPGHKHGTGLKELKDYLGETVFKIDLNAMKDIDDLCNPIGPIKQAEALLADAFGAKRAFMMINGTTSGIHTMFLSACRPGDKIILPRNAHKSTISGLILSGAIPVYVHAEMNKEYGISTTVSAKAIEAAYELEPHSVATFVINPSYWGFSPDLKKIVRISHSYDSAVLVDEAHGCHMNFHHKFPISAMEAGADMAASSMHKTAGSFTQSSILLFNSELIDPDLVKQSANLLRSTSASYLLMLSIDVARKQLVLHGKEMLEETLNLARYARQELNKIEGVFSFGTELMDEDRAIYDFDETKLGIYVRNLGLTGFQMEEMLREKYAIQIEMADLNNIMAIITLGDSKDHVDSLISAIKDIASKSDIKPLNLITQLPDMPTVIVSPRDAYYSHKKSLTLDASIGEIAGEMVMSYPPGIPVICPGEKISKDCIDYIKLLKSENCSLQGTADPYVNKIRVLG